MNKEMMYEAYKAANAAEDAARATLREAKKALDAAKSVADAALETVLRGDREKREGELK